MRAAVFRYLCAPALLCCRLVSPSPRADTARDIAALVRAGLAECEAGRLQEPCFQETFFDTSVTQLQLAGLAASSWFLFARGLQGAAVYPGAGARGGVVAGEHIQGVYIYPDWSSCVQGTWEHHILVQGEGRQLATWIWDMDTLHYSTHCMQVITVLWRRWTSAPGWSAPG